MVTPTLLLALAASASALNPCDPSGTSSPSRAAVAAPEGAKTNYAIAGLSTSTWSGAAPGEPKLALIAGRTVDNPGFFQQALDSGATHILLEARAPTVGELESMAATAEKADVPVFMGFIKNIAPYFTQALDAYGKHPPVHPGSLVTLTSLNDYTEESLGECFERNAEGMLKNMAIHELALAATFFGMTADSIADVAVDAGNCDCRTIGSYTDFAKIDFTLTNKAGGKLRIVADRCGGDGCRPADGSEVVFEAEMVDADRAARVAARQAEHPDWIGYLITQEDEYKDLRSAAPPRPRRTFPASRTSASPSTPARGYPRPCSRRSS
ncbi:hypothetical protein JL720_11759 [Aureococcus anophagefferens]|nr:hypothetical protein JL720_11759 [Aureococcus anophagefferens]